MNFGTNFLLPILVSCYLAIVLGAEDRICDPYSLTKEGCRTNEVCVSNGSVSGICRCKPEYISTIHNECLLRVSSTPSSASSAATSSPEHAEMVHHGSVSSGAITAAVLVPLALAIGGLLILAGRRYHWFERLQLLQGRRYEEVRIGQEDDEDDDPPLA